MEAEQKDVRMRQIRMWLLNGSLSTNQVARFARFQCILKLKHTFKFLGLQLPVEAEQKEQNEDPRQADD